MISQHNALIQIVKVADGCNTCHEALGTTFHIPDRGGNIVVCGMCHITKAGGSHLELQSRSIDSYIHAIHSSRQFDVGDIDFSDPTQAQKYATEIEMPFPKHGITNCEALRGKIYIHVSDLGRVVIVLFIRFGVISHPFWKPIVIKLNDPNQKVAFGRKEIIDILTGFVGHVNGVIHVMM
jgi:hypothetical protein